MVRLPVIDAAARTLLADGPGDEMAEAGGDQVWVWRETRTWPGITIREVNLVTFALRRDQRFFGGAAVAPWVQPAAELLEIDLGEPLGVDRFINAKRPPRVRLVPTMSQAVLVLAMATAALLGILRLVRRGRSAAGTP